MKMEVGAPWDFDDWHHAAMGVELGTDRGPGTVTWTDTSYAYGVEVFDELIGYRPASGDEGPERVGPDGPGLCAWASCPGSLTMRRSCEEPG